MTEHRYAVQVYRTDYLCDKCQAPMQSAHMSKLAIMVGRAGRGTLHKHTCPNCGHFDWLAHEYPVTEYKPVKVLVSAAED